MFVNTSILLHVADAQASGAFYARLLGIAPVEESPTFVFFRLPSGTGLGLWQREGVTPASSSAVGGGEIGLSLPDAAAVDAVHADWVAKGAHILLPPTDLDFGRSFVAADPDGHWVRVYAMAPDPA
ncbi:VOC family protein [Aquabacter sp. P-9]|uniref:VOC family protein n=1 Tax=Aquabacter sediminis TaxID=3029197 RepID=UPI00237E9340|nr:VOC family protein [Aquabacter sp. P-9]MDE1570680.1 VOC family protein [Aquabacter sp. P-9]